MELHDLELLAALLDRAGDVFANHSCNDIDLREHMTEGQAFDLQQRVNDTIGHPDDAPETSAHARIGSDFALMYYYAVVMKQMAYDRKGDL